MRRGLTPSPPPRPPLPAPAPPTPPPPAPPAPPPPRNHGFQLLSAIMRGIDNSLDHWHIFTEESSPNTMHLMAVPRDVFNKDMLKIEFRYTAKVSLKDISMKYKYFCREKLLDECIMDLPTLEPGDKKMYPLIMYLAPNANLRFQNLPTNEVAMMLEFRIGDEVLARVHMCQRDRNEADPPLSFGYVQTECRYESSEGDIGFDINAVLPRNCNGTAPAPDTSVQNIDSNNGNGTLPVQDNDSNNGNGNDPASDVDSNNSKVPLSNDDVKNCNVNESEPNNESNTAPQPDADLNHCNGNVPAADSNLNNSCGTNGDSTE